MLTPIHGHQTAAVAIALSAPCSISFTQRVIEPDLQQESPMPGRPRLPCRGVIAAALLSLGAVAQGQQVILPELAPGHSVASFGSAMVASESELFVGAPAGNGFVAIYRRENGLWISSQRLDPQQTNAYGVLLAVHGDLLAIGSVDTSGTGNWPIYIDLFRKQDDVWVQVQRVDAPSSGADRIELAAESLLVGSNILDINGGVVGARVFSYRLADGILQPPVELVPPYPSAHFGFALAAEGHTLVTSDPFATSVDGAGAISTYTWNGEAWVHGSVMRSQVAAPFYYGTSVAICGARLFVATSAPYSGPLPGNPSGRVTAFRRDDSTAGWIPVGDDIVPSTGPDQQFGRSLDCAGSSLAVTGTSTTQVHAYAINAGNAPVVLTSPDAVALRPRVAVVKGDVALSNPYASGPPLWVGRVHVFADAIDFILISQFE